MTTSTYTVVGMCCGYCVSSVTGEVSTVPGVSGVSVDLVNGRLTVSSDAAIDADAIRHAIQKAGYQLAVQ